MADGICSVEGCNRHGRLIVGMCCGHYTRWARTGDVGSPELRAPREKIKPGSVCAVGDCDRPEKYRGWCKAHASRWERHGDVQAHIPIGPAAQDKVRKPCSVEACERPAHSKGFCNGHGRRVRTFGDPQPEKPLAPLVRGVCAAPNCSDPHYIKGYCIRHHARVQKYGSLDGGIREYDPIILNGRGKSAEDRFWDRVNKNGPTPKWRPELGPCWVWKLSQNGNGYGQTFLFPNVALGTHRVAWHLSGRVLVEGMQLDHLCSNPICCRPDHLEQVRPVVNNFRSNSWAGRNHRKTHCSKGHEYDLLNTAWTKAGHRTCRTCRNGKAARLAAERALTREERAIARAYREAIAGDQCIYCGSAGQEVDHFWPIDRGGSAAFWNLVRSCRRCNRSKGVRCGTWFLLKRGASGPSLRLAA